MKNILGHDLVVQEMEDPFWKAQKIILLLQEQTSVMDVQFIHSLLGFFLFLSVEPFICHH